IFLFAAKANGYPAGSFDASRAEGRKVVAGEVTIIDWALEPGVAVSGRVVDRSDEPVPYATVAFSDPRRRLEGEVSVLTSVDGRYRVEGLRPATYDILVTAAGFAPPTEESESRFVIPQGVDELTKNIVLDYGASLFGSVRSPDGGPVSGARVRVEARGGRRLRDTVRDLVAVSNAVGAWRISGVPPDVELVVEATHDAWARAVSPPIRLQPGDEERLDLVLGEGVRLTGRVTDERGRPVDEARVRWGMVPPGEERRVGDAFRADEFLGPRVVRTDGDGNFVVDRLESGRVLLKVEKEGFADWYRSDIVVGDDTGNRRLEVELERSAVISGSVRDATTGAPLADAWVYAEEQRPDEDEPQDDGRVRALVSAQTGEDGRFVLEGVPPGPSYRVVVWLAVGYQAAVQNRRDPTVRRDDVAAGDADIDFRLERIEESSEGG
ncbi:MAG: carboxypeptidase-like regulatory domain-containing protein, partial [Planctomycetota bacterium]